MPPASASASPARLHLLDSSRSALWDLCRYLILCPGLHRTDTRSAGPSTAQEPTRTQSAGIEKPGEGESRVAGVETAEKIIAKIDECTKVQKN